ncbi:MAG: prepilin-type N-terminal cleavage/methylation domain-containing protein [Parcubacteria group bacterium]
MPRKSRSRQRGFTLIELMIVVVIIGILSALAIPRFMAASTESKQAEARQLLRQIYIAECAYWQEFQEYWGNGLSADRVNPDGFARIGVQIPTSARYTYTIVAGQGTFTATANAPNPGLDDDPTADTWIIDEADTLVCTSDDAIN